MGSLVGPREKGPSFVLEGIGVVMTMEEGKPLMNGRGHLVQVRAP